MTFQNKQFLQLLVIALALVTTFLYSVIRYTKTAFEEIEAQREQTQITQFKQQFARFGDAVVRRVESIANAEATLRMAMDLARPKADKSLYVQDVIGVAQDRNLDVRFPLNHVLSTETLTGMVACRHSVRLGK